MVVHSPDVIASSWRAAFAADGEYRNDHVPSSPMRPAVVTGVEARGVAVPSEGAIAVM
jgi:hypothetical protein